MRYILFWPTAYRGHQPHQPIIYTSALQPFLRGKPFLIC